MIKNEKQYKKALIKLERLIDLNPDIGTKDGLEMERLADYVIEYENKYLYHLFLFAIDHHQYLLAIT